MTGKNETSVTYPEFYTLIDGNLLFMFRDGASGDGNLVMNVYHVGTKKWSVLQEKLIDGQHERNAYWQACVDAHGTVHLSWVWRETADVSSNHDLCYARSRDGGHTWEKSDGKRYTLPITAATAEYACRIPPQSELINQTSMTADSHGNPYIASYWRVYGSRIPQYQIVYRNKNSWQVRGLNFRSTPFTLSGLGTKGVPIARPLILTRDVEGQTSVIMIFRDEERGNKVSAAMLDSIDKQPIRIVDLTDSSVGSWEPTFDYIRWQEEKTVSLFVQYVEQVDGEGITQGTATPVHVLDWKPGLLIPKK
jgi:hypothetical protein